MTLNLPLTLRRFHIDQFFQTYVSTLEPGSSVLDVGGNKIGKRGNFNLDHYNVQPVYINLSRVKSPDIQSDGAQLPVKSESFDTVLCSEMLEHVPEPREILCEIFRVLRSKGTLLVTVPFLVQIHADPHDFGRYTDQYWSYMLSKTGFTKIEIIRQGGFWSVISDLVRAHIVFKDRSGILKSRCIQKIVSFTLSFFYKKILTYEEKNITSTNDFSSKVTTGFGIIAQKK